jgi:hypothetical protein
VTRKDAREALGRPLNFDAKEVQIEEIAMDERIQYSMSRAKEGILLTACFAGIGGMLPTICRVAAASVADTNVAFFTGGHLAAMLVYFALSLMLCVALQEKRWVEAVILGIALPALLTNVLAGATSSHVPASTTAVNVLPIAVARADATPAPATTAPGFWTDLKRGLGYSITTAGGTPAEPSPEATDDSTKLAAENAELRQQLDQLSSERTSARAEADSLRGGNESLTTEAQAARLEADTLRTEREALRGEIARLEKQRPVSIQQNLTHLPPDARMWELSEAFNIRLLAEQMNALSMPDAKKFSGLSASMFNGADPGARDALDKVFRVIIVPTAEPYPEFCRAIKENMQMLWDTYPFKDGVPETTSPGNTLAVSQYAQSLLELTKISLAKCSTPPDLQAERLALQRAATMYQVVLVNR